MIRRQNVAQAAVLAYMAEFEIEPPNGIQRDGKIHNFDRPERMRKGKKSQWYIAYPDDPFVVRFGCHRTGVDEKWVHRNGKPPEDFDPKKWEEIQKAHVEREKREQEARAEKARECEERFENAASASLQHPYLKRKGIKTSFGIRQEEQTLLIPMKAMTKGNPIVSLQQVDPEGEKKYVQGTTTKGARTTIGAGKVKPGQPFYICEGWATGWSIHAATGCPAIVAFSAGNLREVAIGLRDKYPDQTIIIAADNDRWTKTPQGPNPGVQAAKEAATQANCLLACPDFEDLRDKPTDFNDLYLKEGEEAVQKWLDPAMANHAVISDGERDPGLCLELSGSPEELGEVNGKPSPRSFEELLKAAKSLTPDSDPGDVEDVVRAATAQGPVHRRKVFEEVKEATGLTLGVIKEVASLKRLEEKRDQPDHLDLARRAIEEIGSENILSTEAHVYKWEDRGVWRPQERRALRGQVQTSLDQDKGLRVTKGLVDGVSDVLTTEVYRPRHQFNLEAEDVVNCLNGELHLKNQTWVLQPHCRESFRTVQVPVHWDPQAEATEFRRFLLSVFRGDPDAEEKARLVLELLGYSLQTHSRYELFALLLGLGANGKSVLLAIVHALAGWENVAGVQPSQFDNRFQRAHLHLKLVNIVSELREGEVIADAELKAISSGEVMTVEEKFGPPFEIRPYSICWFGTNHLPHTRDFSEALFRRAVVIPFNRRYWRSEDERARWGDRAEKSDPYIFKKLEQELPGIFRLSLQAYGLAVERGRFTDPASCLEAKAQWRLEADQVHQFVAQCCADTPTASEALKDLFQAYELWAAEMGIKRTVGKINFGNRLERLGFPRVRDSQSRRHGGIQLTGEGNDFLYKTRGF